MASGRCRCLPFPSSERCLACPCDGFDGEEVVCQKVVTHFSHFRRSNGIDAGGRAVAKGEDSLGRGARIRVRDVDVKTQPRETRHASSCCGGRRGRGHLVEVTISPGCVFGLGAQLAGTDSLHAFRPPRRRIRRGRCTIRRGFSLHRRSIHHIWRRTQVEVVELAQLLCSRSFGSVHDGDVVGRWGGRARGGHCRLRFDGPPLHLGVIQSRTRCRWLCLDHVGRSYFQAE